MKADRDYGHIEVRLEEVRKQRGVSKNYIEEHAAISRTQLLNYCNNKMQRVDLAIISRLCAALDCRLDEILVYIPPEQS